MNFKKALCWSFAAHLFIIIILFSFFPLRSENNYNLITVNLIDIPSYAADTNGTPQNIAYVNASTKKTTIQPFSIPDNSKVQSNRISSQHIFKTNKSKSTPSKPPSLPVDTTSKNIPEKQQSEKIPDSEPMLKFMAPVNYNAQKGGNCTFKILVSEEGRPLRIEIEQGSSNSDLDTAVKEALKQSEYIPAIIDGFPSQGWLTFSYRHWNISNKTPTQH